jgi:hypothetical protein
MDKQSFPIQALREYHGHQTEAAQPLRHHSNRRPGLQQAEKALIGTKMLKRQVCVMHAIAELETLRSNFKTQRRREQVLIGGSVWHGFVVRK